MSKKLTPLRQYYFSSQSIHYGLILTLPVLALYEIGTFFLFNDSTFELRNTGEVLIRQLFNSTGLHNPYIISGLLLALFGFVMIRGYRIEKAPGIHADYLLFMLLESAIWGTALFISMEGFAQLTLQMISVQEKILNINLALGAGIFEELIFRMILISALLIILKHGLSLDGRWAEFSAILMAALVFAAFHLFLESYVQSIFLQRVFGGLFLGYLYRYRGYGIAVYSHIVFNLFILAGTW